MKTETKEPKKAMTINENQDVYESSPQAKKPTESSMRSDMESSQKLQDGMSGEEGSPRKDMPAPGLQRTGAMPAAKMSTIDDGYDTETMAKIEANTKKEVDNLKAVVFK